MLEPPFPERPSPERRSSKPPSPKPPSAGSDSRSNHDEARLLLPASCRNKSYTFYDPGAESDISTFLLEDLSVARLNKIHDLLWLVGQPLPPRPLSFQLAVSRVIVLDERADMHLVWEKCGRLHLKPLPRYLLDHQFWRKHICSPKPESPNPEDQDRNIYRNALGFLHSYIALIQHESDFGIAQEHGLIPKSLDWEIWVTLVEQMLFDGKISDPKNLNRRYKFGELRLSRLNLIYRYHQGIWPRGYEFPFQTYNDLLRSYIAPITVATIYMALTLTAMQVGLATKRLGQNMSFQRASYGAAVFSILAPLVLLLPLAMIATFIFIVSLLKALKRRKLRLSDEEDKGSKFN